MSASLQQVKKSGTKEIIKNFFSLFNEIVSCAQQVGWKLTTKKNLQKKISSVSM
jgi:hypothetical protein